MEHKLVSVCKCCLDNAPVKCPVCREGNIKKIDFMQNMSVFYGCSNHPFCNHTFKACPICQKALSRTLPRQDKYFCIDIDCHGSVDKCKSGDGHLRRLIGPEGAFWGCTDYKDTNCNSSKAYTEENAEECNVKRIVLNARDHAINFYRISGYETIKKYNGSDTGIPHTSMRKNISISAN